MRGTKDGHNFCYGGWVQGVLKLAINFMNPYPEIHVDEKAMGLGYIC